MSDLSKEFYHELVISHDPFFQKEFCLDSTGTKITNEKDYNIYKLSQEEIMKFDCGSLKNPKFDEQQLITQYKPLWREFKELKELDSSHIILFEIKSVKADYGKSQPFPDELFHHIFILDQKIVYLTIILIFIY